MSTMTRLVETGDHALLVALDAAYALRRSAPTMVERAVLAFYARSGHAFVRDGDGVVCGFALAHAVWDGGRPAIRLARLVAHDDAPGVLRALVEAVVKSAYDAAVYDLVAEVPTDDEAALAALTAVSFAPRPVVHLERVLGSRVGERVAP
ncbi:MAG: DUF1999 family protein [Trueperaceae bacterium]|nr:DUF1999 family protein [Trueperaceae bacterium]